MRNAIYIAAVLLFLISTLNAQETEQEVDLNYLEDQFYVGVTYNFILNKPVDVNQRNLSYGLQLGFIKDLPINTSRTIAIGLGLGYAVNSYYTNLRIVEGADDFQYGILEGDLGTKRNKLETHLVEIPIEFRLRNSTPTEYKFWRFYLGAKLGYAFGSRSKLVTDVGKDSFYVTDVEKFRYGLMANFGYNTFNIHVYYALNNLFKDGLNLDTGQDLTFTPLRVGFVFYIL